MPSLRSLGAVLVAVVACGGEVVSEPGGQSESAAGQGAASASASGSTGGAAGSTGSTVASSVQSSSTGPANPCAGQPCGTECTVCNDVECFMGACDTNETCDMPSQICKTLDPATGCPPKEQADALICTNCGGGKGCSFVGCVISGPRGGDGTCCYYVVGGCAPNP